MFPEIVQQDAAAAHVRLRVLLHPAELLHVNLPLSALLGKSRQLHQIAQGIEQDRLGRQAVAPGTPDFLIKALDAFGQVVMDDKPHVGLVDTHPEGHRGTDHLQAVVDKVVLHPLAHLRRQAGMVSRRHNPMPAKHVGHALRRLFAHAIDNAAIVPVTGYQAEDGTVLVLLLIPAPHVQAQVRTVEGRDEHFGVGQAQLLLDVLPRQPVGRRGQSHNRHTGKSLPQQPQLRVFRTEVMPPLGNAVRLVDGEQRNPHVPYQIGNLQHQPLRRNVQQFHVPPQTSRTDPHVLGLVVHAVQRGRRYAVGLQPFHLVLHQGNQGRHHHRRPLTHQGRHLIAQTLPASRGHQHHHIASGQDTPDDFLLQRTERSVTKIPL